MDNTSDISGPHKRTNTDQIAPLTTAREIQNGTVAPIFPTLGEPADRKLAKLERSKVNSPAL